MLRPKKRLVIVTRDDRTSLKLLTASRTMAVEWTATPTRALKDASRTFATMPTMPVITIVFSLDAVLSFPER